MHRAVIWFAAGLLWLASLEGVLRLRNLPTSTFGEHGVCGPWGCSAPTPVLLACHGFWLILIVPPAAMAARYLTRQWVRRLGLGLFFTGFCGLIAVAAWEAVTWLPQVSAWHRHYFGQRFLFSVATLVDVPMLQFLVIGAGLWLTTRSLAGPQAEAVRE